MSTGTRESAPGTLELPDAFEDLTGVIALDLNVIVTALTERAGERLLLSRAQRQQLQHRLWNNLTRVINQAVEPLSIERR